MGTHTGTLVILAVALVCGGTLAQAKKGSAAPTFNITLTWNDAPTSQADLAGKIVIIEYAHPEHEVCKQSIPHLLHLHKKYAARGLLVLGMADVPEATIQEQFVKGLGAIYPWIKSNDFYKKFGIKFLPSAFCIDGYGNVQSLADWWVPDEAAIEELLQTLPLPPKLPADKRYDPLRMHWQKGEYGKLCEGIAKMLTLPNVDAATREALAAQQAALDTRREAQLARVAELGAGPDYTAATGELERMEKAWLALPPAAAARKELDRFAADDKIKLEVAAGVALQKLMAPVDTSKIPALRKVIVDLDKFRKKYVGTWAGKRADFHHTRLCSRPDGS